MFKNVQLCGYKKIKAKFYLHERNIENVNCNNFYSYYPLLLYTITFFKEFLKFIQSLMSFITRCYLSFDAVQGDSDLL